MKKYKLIKEYPGSPKLGYETIFKEGYPFVTIRSYRFCLEDCKKYPEFWEEIVEYPVGTRVHNSQTNTIYTKKEDGWYKPMEKTAYTDEMIGSKKHLTLSGRDEEVVEKDYEILKIKAKSNHPNITVNKVVDSWVNVNLDYFYIHSVKRLSDGEVFTVGDNVTETITGSCNGWKISEFSLKDTRCFTAGVNINNIEKIIAMLNAEKGLKNEGETAQQKYLINATYKVDESWFTDPIKASNITLHFLKGVIEYELKDSYIKDGKFIAHYKLITNINKQELYKELLDSSTRVEDWTIGIN